MKNPTSMRLNLRDRTVTFRHEDGRLVRTVGGDGGHAYTHRCALAAFEAVAHRVDETPAEGAGVTMEQIAAAEGLPITQTDLALAFLKERGLVERRHRRNYPASGDVYLDAMVEWHALAHAAQRPAHSERAEAKSD